VTRSTIRTFLRSRTSYDAFPVSFRAIVLDSQLEVKKALQCLLVNAGYECDVALCLNLTCPRCGLWDSEKLAFAGMLSVSISDIIHLILYYYHTSSYDNAATDVESFRLDHCVVSIPLGPALMQGLIAVP
jgi:hypothetical protein